MHRDELEELKKHSPEEIMDALFYAAGLLPLHSPSRTVINDTAAMVPRLIAEVELKAVYSDIKAERVRQDEQWGGPQHDDTHVEEEWRDYRARFEDRVQNIGLAFRNPRWMDGVRANLVKIAALAVAQIEALDRKHSPPALQSRGSHGA